jgi:hypothetical protein
MDSTIRIFRRRPQPRDVHGFTPRAAQQLNAVIAKANSGDGTVGRLLNDRGLSRPAAPNDAARFVDARLQEASEKYINLEIF